METVSALSQLYHGDCMDAIPLLEDSSIDLVVTSPPYNVDLGNNKYHRTPYDLYNDNKDHTEYMEWLKGIFASLLPKLKVGGRVCINIGDGKNGKVPTHSDVIQMMKELEYLSYGQIIWNKNMVASRTAWGSFASPSCPSFLKPFEYILIFAKETTKLQWRGDTDITRQEFIDWSMGIWNIQPEIRMKKYGHPAMFPLDIPTRLIKMLSWQWATVFDPFSGLGTTGVACELLNRHYIGCELSEGYYNKAVERIKGARA
jgi:site-specific DNA-methyltransferase (adenine-specific)